MTASLKDYKTKRNFARTTEPPATALKRGKPGAVSGFVIQKHDATRLHYDFRLEMGGVLKSWAVPKGIPWQKGERRLAVEVEDHPVSYGSFEGTIPQGNYGGGTVMLWDHGTYEEASGHPLAAWKKGKLHLMLHGKKLEGAWTLVRTRAEKNWLLIKSGEDMKAVSKKADDSSVSTGRRMKEIAAGDVAPVKLRRAATPARSMRTAATHGKSAAPGGFIPPMLAKAGELPADPDNWEYELKWDGYRALAIREGNAVRFISRNANDLTARYPELAEALAELSAKHFVIDGEIVAHDPKGRPAFHLLQDSQQNDAPLLFYAFDVISTGKKILTSLPLEERRRQLHKLLGTAPPDGVRYSATLKGDPRKLLAEVARKGLEGLIAKRKGSLYESGRRSGAWAKIKCLRRQEFVIAGYTAPKGSRAHLGALLLGYFEKGKLHYAGRAGTGFDTAEARRLEKLLRALKRDTPPIDDLRRGTLNLPPQEARNVTWVDPKLVCETKFTEWTPEGRLRHPVYAGLRDDKNPREVSREA